MALQDGTHGHREAACLCVASWKRNAIGNDYQPRQYRSSQFSKEAGSTFAPQQNPDCAKKLT
jgi:hypothetical protein